MNRVGAAAVDSRLQRICAGRTNGITPSWIVARIGWMRLMQLVFRQGVRQVLIVGSMYLKPRQLASLIDHASCNKDCE